jgi:crotonobetainyl-CoA:carnitine CoA-transferase CaiB-like acyl-CoA transferase
LGYEALKAVNRRIILTSITPFGQDGPYHAWHGSDIVCMAMGGLMGLTGEANGRPVRLSLPQAALHAGVEAAVASLLAHHWRASSGEGQHIDVSMQACVLWTLMAAPGFVPCLGTMPTRGGPCYNWFGYPRRLNFPCADGAVALYLVGGLAGGRSMQALARLMQAEGLALGWMLEQDWTTWSLSRRGAQGQAESEQLDQAVLGYTCTKTKQELYDLALQHRILLAPVSNIGDLYHNTQLQARQFFVPVHHPALNTCFGYPGAFARFSRTPCLPPRQAPLIGEHTGQILFEELGVDDRTLETLAADGVIACRSPRATPSTVPVPPRPEPPAATTTPPARPLEGIRVLDFTWVYYQVFGRSRC